MILKSELLLQHAPLSHFNFSHGSVSPKKHGCVNVT